MLQVFLCYLQHKVCIELDEKIVTNGCLESSDVQRESLIQ
jgi:hypothetical protein